MDWPESTVTGTGEQPYIHTPQASMHISKQSEPCDAARPNEAGHSPFVKVEQSYPPYHASEVSDSGVYSSTQAMLYTYGSPNTAAYTSSPEYGPDSQAEAWMVSPYFLRVDVGSHIASLRHMSPRTVHTYQFSRGAMRLCIPTTRHSLIVSHVVGPPPYRIIVPTPSRMQSHQSHQPSGHPGRSISHPRQEPGVLWTVSPHPRMQYLPHCRLLRLAPRLRHRSRCGRLELPRRPRRQILRYMSPAHTDSQSGAGADVPGSMHYPLHHRHLPRSIIPIRRSMYPSSRLLAPPLTPSLSADG